MKRICCFLWMFLMGVPVFAQEGVQVKLSGALGKEPEVVLLDSARIAEIARVVHATLSKCEEMCTDEEGKVIADPEKKILHDVKRNTTRDWWRDDFNAYGCLAIVVAFAAAGFTILTYRSQKETERHTRETERHSQNAPLAVQLGVLDDMPRHFYRNLVCSCAIISRYKDKRNYAGGVPLKYPSESNFLKLQTMPEDVLLKIDVHADAYKKMHEASLQFRNYCIEVRVASEHVSRKRISAEALADDFDNLVYKPLYLARTSAELKALLAKVEEKEVVLDFMLYMYREHIKKLEMEEVVRFFIGGGGQTDVFSEEYFGVIDGKGGVRRSLGKLLKETGGYKYKCFLGDEMLDRELLKKELLAIAANDEDAGEDEEIRKKNDEIRKITGWFDIAAFVDAEIEGLDAVAIKESGAGGREELKLRAASLLKPYMEVVAGERIDCRRLLEVMLCLDMAVEAGKAIGMVDIDGQQ